MTLKLGKARVTLHDSVIERLPSERGVGEELLEVAEDISAEVKAQTAGSRRLKQYGRKMVADRTETGARAGTTWGPAVPVEFGTFQTPAHRILTNIAARFGRTR